VKPRKVCCLFGTRPSLSTDAHLGASVDALQLSSFQSCARARKPFQNEGTNSGWTHPAGISQQELIYRASGSGLNNGPNTGVAAAEDLPGHHGGDGAAGRKNAGNPLRVGSEWSDARDP
jgi:hypothetical protein